MWTCEKCGEKLDEQYYACWKCQTVRSSASEAPPPLKKELRRPRVEFRHFRSGFESWDSLFGQAAQFASELGPGRLINISHSEDGNDGVVTVWYWSETPGGD